MESTSVPLRMRPTKIGEYFAWSKLQEQIAP